MGSEVALLDQGIIALVEHDGCDYSLPVSILMPSFSRRLL